MEDIALALTGGRLDAGRAWQAAGHKSADSFAKAFSKKFLASPEDFAAARASGELRLRYGGPFDAAKTLDYLGRDRENQAETVSGPDYTRYYSLGGNPVKAMLRLEGRRWAIRFPRGMSARRLLKLHGLAVHMLGLRQPLSAFQRMAADHPVLAPLVKAMPGVRMIQTPSLWEALTWAIMGQQINLPFAYRLRNRFIALGGGHAIGASHALPRRRPIPFPDPQRILSVEPGQLRSVQFSGRKTEYLLGLAREFVHNGLDDVTPGSYSPEELEGTLLAVRGLGPWSVAYGMMRGLSYQDALPVGDAGLRQALRARFNLDAPPDAARQIELMEPFRPYRSFATYYLWKSLNPANLA